MAQTTVQSGDEAKTRLRLELAGFSCMESLADVYRDLLLQRLKYEHLCGVCRRLLKSWPRHDSSGRPIKDMAAAETSACEERRQTDKKQDKNQTVPGSKSSAIAHPAGGERPAPSQSQDLQLLEDILGKAQRIRASLPADGARPKPEQNTQKSLTPPSKKRAKGSSYLQAASVYGSAKVTKKHPVKVTSKTHLTASKSARMKPKTGTSRVTGASYRRKAVLPTGESSPATVTRRSTSERKDESISGLRRESGRLTSADVEGLRRPSETPPSDDPAPLYAQVEELTLEGETVSSVAVATTSKNQSSGCQGVSHEEKEFLGFNIKHDGCHLSMPPKYYRLHRRVTKITEHLQARRSGGRAAAEHFCSRLMAKEPAGAAETIRLLLAREEYAALKDQLRSLTPQELAVSERTRWQDVLEIKTKLEFIDRRIQELHERLAAGEHPEGSPHDDLQDQDFTAPPPHVYSSLEDWQSLALSELRLRLQSCEVAILKFCKEVVIPRIDQMQQTDSKHLPALVQAVYDLAGLHSKPVFLVAEQ